MSDADYRGYKAVYVIIKHISRIQYREITTKELKGIRIYD